MQTCRDDVTFGSLCTEQPSERIHTTRKHLQRYNRKIRHHKETLRFCTVHKTTWFKTEHKTLGKSQRFQFLTETSDPLLSFTSKIVFY